MPIVFVVVSPLSRAAVGARVLLAYEQVPPMRGRATEVHGLRLHRWSTPEEAGVDILVLPGMHPDGAQEARLVRLATALHAQGFSVGVVDLPPLREFRVDVEIAPLARLVDALNPAVVIGISVGGALALRLVEPRHGVRAILTLGAYADLPTVVRQMRRPDAPPYAHKVLRALQQGRVAEARLRTLNPRPKTGPPIWIVHGARDPLIDPEQARRLCQRFATRCRGSLVTEQLGHARTRAASLAGAVALASFISEPLRYARRR